MDVIGPIVRLEVWPSITMQNWRRLPDSGDLALWQHLPSHAVYQVMRDDAGTFARLAHVCDGAALPSVADQEWYGAAAIVLEGLSCGFSYWSVRFVPDDTPAWALPAEDNPDPDLDELMTPAEIDELSGSRLPDVGDCDDDIPF